MRGTRVLERSPSKPWKNPNPKPYTLNLVWANRVFFFVTICLATMFGIGWRLRGNRPPARHPDHILWAPPMVGLSDLLAGTRWTVANARTNTRRNLQKKTRMYKQVNFASPPALFSQNRLCPGGVQTILNRPGYCSRKSKPNFLRNTANATTHVITFSIQLLGRSPCQKPLKIHAPGSCHCTWQHWYIWWHSFRHIFLSIV